MPRWKDRSRTAAAALALVVALAAGALINIAVPSVPAQAAAGWSPAPVGSDGWPARDSLVQEPGTGGTTHLAFFDPTDHAVRYATCAGTCGPGSPTWAATTVATTNEYAWYASLARDGNGRLHLAWVDVDLPAFDGVLRYATCAASCLSASSWTTTTLRWVGDLPSLSLAVASNGTVHIAGVGRDLAGSGWGDLFYATCVSSCGSASSWTDTSLLPIGQSVVNPDHTSIQLDELGRPRFVYAAHVQGNRQGDTVFVASCDSSCSSSSSWLHAPLTTGFCCPATLSFVLENGRGHIALQFFDTWPLPTIIPGVGGPVYNGYGNLAYLSCASSCTAASNWSSPTVVDLPANVVAPKLAVSDGRPHIAFLACVHCFTLLEEYQSWMTACSAACADPRSWGSERIAVAGDTNGLTLASDGDGLTVAYGNAVTVARCFVDCTPPPDLVPFGAEHAELVLP